MRLGDNWIGQAVSAIENGPDWRSTAIFITYDDCGCFYDHVAPPAGRGIRVPMVIVSPYARAGFTDSTTATFSGMLAYIEHTFGLAALASADAAAYDFRNAFDYSQSPLPPIPLGRTPVPRAELRRIAAHPPDVDDPT
jgi:phospholipase C